jgi:hypothetical protein
MSVLFFAEEDARYSPKVYNLTERFSCSHEPKKCYLCPRTFVTPLSGPNTPIGERGKSGTDFMIYSGTGFQPVFL